jgi:hypothetical protein
MAAVSSEEQFLEMILNDDEDHETDESCEPDNDQFIRGKLVDLVASFDAGPEFKHGFFSRHCRRITSACCTAVTKGVSRYSRFAGFSPTFC